MAQQAARQAGETDAGTERTPTPVGEKVSAPWRSLDPLIIALSRAVDRLEKTAG